MAEFRNRGSIPKSNMDDALNLLQLCANIHNESFHPREDGPQDLLRNTATNPRGLALGGFFWDSAPTLANGQFGTFRFTSDCKLMIDGGGGGDATAANQTTMITALADLLTELQLKADLAETQPVDVSTTPSWNNFANFGTLSQAQVKNSPGKVYAFTCENYSATTDLYLQIHDTTSVLVGGEVPLKHYPVFKNGGYTFAGKELLGDGGLNCATGIRWAWSTTAGTFTAATAGDQITQIDYL